MTSLDELLDTCAGSSRADWNLITCWGARSGPSYLDHFVPGIYQGEFQLRHAQHGMRAAYKPDPVIGIAWGLDPDNVFPEESRSFTEEWSANFADPRWTFHIADFLYYGNLVHREPFVIVDGGRCYLPVPDYERAVSTWAHDFFKMLDGLERSSEFDRYFEQAGFSIR